MRKIIVDTNVLMNGYDKIPKDGKIVIPLMAIEELDKHKYSNDTNKQYMARCALRSINENLDNIEFAKNYRLCDDINLTDLSVADNVIILQIITYINDNGIHDNYEILTYDLNMYLKCKALDKNCIYMYNNSDNHGEYKGYKKISGNSEFINEYMNNINHNDWYINEYLIIHDADTDKYKEMRYDGESFVPLKLPSSHTVKGKNSLQRCALDLLNNKDITTVGILGVYGSGKSFLSMKMAIHNVIEKKHQDKILGVREVLGSGKEVGYLKGDFTSKTEMFFTPLKQQIDESEYEYMVMTKKLDTNIPFYMKGTTYNDTIILVDEAEDLNISQIKLVGTRLGTNSRIFFSGDYKQSEVDKTTNNALVRMCHGLKGNPMFGCIILDDDVRSETSKMFAELFDAI